MKIHHRLAIASVSLGLALHAQGQSYPVKRIRMIVPTSGGAYDSVARAMQPLGGIRTDIESDGSVTVESDLYCIRFDAQRGGASASLYQTYLQRELCVQGKLLNEFRGRTRSLFSMNVDSFLKEVLRIGSGIGIWELLPGNGLVCLDATVIRVQS